MSNSTSFTLCKTLHDVPLIRGSRRSLSLPMYSCIHNTLNTLQQYSPVVPWSLSTSTPIPPRLLQGIRRWCPMVKYGYSPVICFDWRCHTLPWRVPVRLPAWTPSASKEIPCRLSQNVGRRSSVVPPESGSWESHPSHTRPRSVPIV